MHLTDILAVLSAYNYTLQNSSYQQKQLIIVKILQGFTFQEMINGVNDTITLLNKS